MRPEGVPSELRTIGLVNTLRRCQLLAGLPQQDFEKIAAVTVVKPLEKGEYLFHEGDPAIGFYIVQTGAINVHRVSAGGREQTIHMFRPGESFAEVALASEKGYPADARAVEPSQVLLVQKAGILDLIRRQPELAMRMLGSMSSHLRVLVGQLEDLTLKDVETRLANWLLKRCPRPLQDKQATIQLTVTKRVLASELGTVSETLSRTLAKFREQNLVSSKGKTLIIRSPPRLEELLRGNLGER
jgi:CRP/FNR family transcriptional regulator, dissimilatory nitrate respiration regulator